MRKSEFLAKRRAGYEGSDMGRFYPCDWPAVQAKKDAAIAEEAGVKWDPEPSLREDAIPFASLVLVVRNGQAEIAKDRFGTTGEVTIREAVLKLLEHAK